MNTRNILILGQHSQCNAGDQAILMETLRQTRAAFPAAKITVISNDPRHYTPLMGEGVAHSIRAWVTYANPDGSAGIRRFVTPFYAVVLLIIGVVFRTFGWRWRFFSDPEKRQMLDAYFDADLALGIGGGYLFASADAGSWFLSLWLMLALAVWMGKPLALLPQSIGPFGATWQRRAMAWLARRSFLVMPREAESLETLRKLNAASTALLWPDLALGLRCEPAPARAPSAQTPAPMRVGFTLLDWQAHGNHAFAQQDYETVMLALIDHVTSAGGEAHLLCQVWGPMAHDDDRHVTRRVFARAKNPERVILHPVLENACDLAGLYATMDVFVATRMHSAIFAMLGCVPTLVIGYQPKSIGLMRMLGLEPFCLPIEQLDPATLIARFEALVAQREAVSLALSAQVARLGEQARGALAEVARRLGE